jgi:triosephosphate isomerase
MRPFLVAANWKLNKSPRDSVEFFKQFLAKYERTQLPKTNQAIFFVPAIDLWVTQEVLRNSAIGFGAQNSYFENKGAFTGENSPAVIAEIGCAYSLVGHSERRAIFHETDEETGRKVKALQDCNVTPMLCVGESLAEREASQTNEVIVRQLRAGLKHRNTAGKVILAYEPVWAIGTGKVATPDQAGDAHLVLRRALSEIGGESLANSTPILYGGSVKPDNASQIAKQKEVDGFLVGGASLEVDSFMALCQVEKTA